MAKRRENVTECLKLASRLSEQQQLELISRLSSRLLSKKVLKAKTKTWMDIAGLGAEVLKDMDAQEYVDRERENWEELKRNYR